MWMPPWLLPSCTPCWIEKCQLQSSKLIRKHDKIFVLLFLLHLHFFMHALLHPTCLASVTDSSVYEYVLDFSYD